MNPLTWFSAGRWLLALGLLVALIGGGAILKGRYDAAQQRIGYERRAAEDEAAAEAQTQRMHDLQRAAEMRYTVVAEVRDHFITETIVEVRHEAAPMAVCPVPEPLRLRLNAVARCARGDSAAACGAADAVRDSR